MNRSFELDAAVLPLLRCPVTQTPLAPAAESLITQANASIDAAKLVDQLGQPVLGPIEAGFINADQSLLIPVRGGIVVMLEDRLIPLNQLTST